MRLAITIAGRQAQRLIDAAEEATVIAVFARSLYLRDAAGRIACFGGPGLGEGPLNALCASWPEAAAVAANTAASWHSGLLRIGPVELDPTQARLWQPAPSVSLNAPRLKRSLVRLAAIPARGLGRMIPALVGGTLSARLRGERVRAQRADEVGHDEHRNQDHLTLPAASASGPFPLPRFAAERDKGNHADSRLSDRFERSLDDGLLILASWLRDPAGDPPAAIAMLLGLGPGLTPAGDDALGGALIALRGFGREDVADRLAGWLLPSARTATSNISFAHLAAAAEGEGAAALHDTLASLAGDDATLAEGVARLDRIGHSSGWDALAGAVAALSSAGGR